MSSLPLGTVTFLFTDIEGSTKLWEQHPRAMKAALAKHDALLKVAIESNHGQIIKTTGDGIHAVFSTAIDSINAALAAQREFQISEAPKSGETSEVSLRIRMGIHTGEAEMRAGDYYGSTLNRATRIMSIGHGGQILISDTTYQIAQEHLSSDAFVLDLGEYQLKGFSKPEKIHQVSIPGLQQEFPALKFQAHATNNLPTQLTSFVGRKRELTEAKSRLENARLLTLIGPGGTGKTRLSIQLGSKLLSNFKDGTWLVELAPIADSSLIVRTIASTLNIGEVPGVPLKVLVHEFLREKHLLIILDNCEHLIETSAKVADELLHVAPSIKIIASSREALGINGETVYRVPSLSLPEQADVTKEAAMGCESVQLFVERASASNRKFQLTEENASSVAQICSRLDGIPLAIELAASRITVFPPEQIAKRLDDRFKLLTGGSRTALPRQQTLRALIDWSYDLLNEDERALLRSLSVFAGGWTFEAAETICNNVDVFEHLPQLVNKSLVTVNDEGDEPRYYLLETIRQYAREKFFDAEEVEVARDRHLSFFVQFVEKADESFRISDQPVWINRLLAELDNLRSALEWSASSNPFSTLRIVGAMTYLWIVGGYSSEGFRWTQSALHQVDNNTAMDDMSTEELQTAKAKALRGLAWLYLSFGDNENAKQAAEESVVIYRQGKERRGLSFSLLVLAYPLGYLGMYDRAEALLRESIEISRTEGDVALTSWSLSLLANMTIAGHHNIKLSRQFAEEAYHLASEAGLEYQSALSCDALGMIAIHEENFEGARLHFKESLKGFQEVGTTFNALLEKSNLAHLERAQGNYANALKYYRETIVAFRNVAQSGAVAHQLECFGFISIAKDEYQRALRLFAAADFLRQKGGTPMTPEEQVYYNDQLNTLRGKLDAMEFNSLWSKGSKMTMGQAIEFALETKNE